MVMDQLTLEPVEIKSLTHHIDFLVCKLQDIKLSINKPVFTKNLKMTFGRTIASIF